VKGALIEELANQDETDFTKSVEFTMQHYESLNKDDRLDYVIALWTTGGRIDHCLSCINTLQKNVNKIPVYLFDPRESMSWMLKPVGNVWCHFFKNAVIKGVFSDLI
jgi:thiamine pyrophosphokinase